MVPHLSLLDKFFWLFEPRGSIYMSTFQEEHPMFFMLFRCERSSCHSIIRFKTFSACSVTPFSGISHRVDISEIVPLARLEELRKVWSTKICHRL